MVAEMRMRITGGRDRSRLLVAPRGQGTRPTADRVREALFAILGGERPFAGARVLDLYAGTGALAFESISRGARAAVLVERDREALAAIRANVAALGYGAAVRVVPTSVERAVKTLAGEAFDLVFADPPYADVTSGEAVRALLAAADAGLVAAGGRLVLEHAKRDAPPDLAPHLVLDETRSYGDTSLALYRKPEREASPPDGELDDETLIDDASDATRGDDG